MKYSTHRIGGFCLGTISGILITQTNTVQQPLITLSMIILGSTIGSCLPDIDEPNSHIGNKVKPVSVIIKHTAGHRQAFHSPAIWMIILMVLGLIAYRYGANYSFIYSGLLGLGIGIGSHLLLDMLTIGGIPLLYPITSKKFHLLPLRTGKHDWIVKGVLLGFTLIFTIIKLGGRPLW